MNKIFQTSQASSQFSCQNSSSSLADESLEPPGSINVDNSKQKQIKYVSKLKIMWINSHSVVNKNMNLLVNQNLDILTDKQTQHHG